MYMARQMKVKVKRSTQERKRRKAEAHHKTNQKEKFPVHA